MCPVNVAVAAVTFPRVAVAGFPFTVILHSAVLAPSSVVTVIVVSPDFKAVTFPSVTEATVSLLLLQVTFLFVALSGLTVAVKETSSPSFNSRDVLSRDTLSTKIAFATTVTSHVAVLPPSSLFAVMVALPALTAVTTPSATVATEELLEIQRTFLLSASDGDMVAVRF